MNIIQRTASKSAGKYVENRVLTVQRQIPPGLSKHDEKILHKIKKRAHVLDKGFKIVWYAIWLDVRDRPYPCGGRCN